MIAPRRAAAADSRPAKRRATRRTALAEAAAREVVQLQPPCGTAPVRVRALVRRVDATTMAH